MGAAARAGMRARAVALLRLLAAGEARPPLEDAAGLVQVSIHQAAGFMPLPVSPELLAETRDGLHNRLVMAGARLQASCHADPADCKQSLSILDMLVWMTNAEMFQAADGTQIQRTSLGQVQSLLGLRYWLHHPGPTWSFTAADKDNSGGISPRELESTFGGGLGQISNSSAQLLKVRLFGLMDTDGNGKVTRQELAAHLRAALRVRELVPAVDAEPLTQSFADAARELQHIVKPPRKIQRRMPHWLPPLVVACAALACWLLHRLCLCVAQGRNSKA